MPEGMEKLGEDEGNHSKAANKETKAGICSGTNPTSTSAMRKREREVRTEQEEERSRKDEDWDAGLWNWKVFLVATFFKGLLAPAYRSTDMEVHRHWMALTYTKPLAEWYRDQTTENGLDYPPLFAYVERALAPLAQLADPEMVSLRAEGHETEASKLFMRSTVLAADAFILVGVNMLARKKDVAAALLLLWPGLTLVDHVHFQYNGLLIGALLISAGLLSGSQPRAATACAVALVHLKHLFAFAAIPIAASLLSFHILPNPKQFLILLAEALLVSSVSLGPFIATGQLKGMIERLFPFQRGLVHAYWAPNAWALYCAADKALSPGGARLVRGVLGQKGLSVLPEPSPKFCIALSLAFAAPSMWAAWNRHDKGSLLLAVSQSLGSSFFFGFHAHEKASLAFVAPLAVDAPTNPVVGRLFLLLSTVSSFAVHPLIHRPQEWPFKVAYLLVFPHLSSRLLSSSPGTTPHEPLRWHERAYLLGFIPLEGYCAGVHRAIFADRLPFLPLMLTSTYAAVGMAYG